MEAESRPFLVHSPTESEADMPDWIEQVSPEYI